MKQHSKIILSIKNNWMNLKRKPKLFVRMKKHELFNRITNGFRLRTIDISVTSRCNFRCHHCYATDLLNEEMVPLSVMKNTIEQLIELGVFHFVFQGGEAITDMDRLVAMVRMAKPTQSYINIVSNGYDITRKKINELKGLGVDKITISLDSGIACEHDENRNMPGSFKRAVAALNMITDMGLHTSFSTTITHQNLHSKGIKSLFEFSKKNKYRMDIQIAAPVGLWENRDDLLVTEEDAAYILNQVNINKRNLNGQGLVNRDIYPRMGRQGCPAVKEFMSITPNGELLPCTFIHTSFGNIRDRSIESMRNDALNVHWFNRYPPHCLYGQDQEFIDKCIHMTYGKPTPVDAYEVYKF